jgi:hypothetical protein
MCKVDDKCSYDENIVKRSKKLSILLAIKNRSKMRDASDNSKNVTLNKSSDIDIKNSISTPSNSNCSSSSSNDSGSGNNTSSSGSSSNISFKYTRNPVWRTNWKPSLNYKTFYAAKSNNSKNLDKSDNSRDKSDYTTGSAFYSINTTTFNTSSDSSTSSTSTTSNKSNYTNESSGNSLLTATRLPYSQYGVPISISQDIPINDIQYEKRAGISQLSKYTWGKRYIPMIYLNKIVSQLKDGNEFILSYNEWISGEPADIEMYAGYFEIEGDGYEDKKALIKLTNGDRRRLLRLGIN